jgi:hypothetical protein
LSDPLPGFRAKHGLADPTASHWHLRLGPAALRLPNFAWRQAAIDAHDLHHVMTGYPLTMRGEIQLAAWEWGAGRYPDWRATAFCAPLIVIGVMLMPKRTWKAFRRGRTSQSLYPPKAPPRPAPPTIKGVAVEARAKER